MAEIGVRELKARASEIVRAVRERRARYLLTYRGRPVGVLLPLAEDDGARQAARLGAQQAWDELAELGQQVAQSWRVDQNAVDLLQEMRR